MGNFMWPTGDNGSEPLAPVSAIEKRAHMKLRYQVEHADSPAAREKRPEVEAVLLKFGAEKVIWDPVPVHRSAGREMSDAENASTLAPEYGGAGLGYVSYGLIAREIERVD